MSLPLPGLLRPWQPDPKVSLTVASSLVAETNLGFAGLALVGHKGRSGASSVASCGQCSSTLYPCHAEGSHTQATSGARQAGKGSAAAAALRVLGGKRSGYALHQFQEYKALLGEDWLLQRCIPFVF